MCPHLNSAIYSIAMCMKHIYLCMCACDVHVYVYRTVIFMPTKINVLPARVLIKMANLQMDRGM